MSGPNLAWRSRSSRSVVASQPNREPDASNVLPVGVGSSLPPLRHSSNHIEALALTTLTHPAPSNRIRSSNHNLTRDRDSMISHSLGQ